MTRMRLKSQAFAHRQQREEARQRLAQRLYTRAAAKRHGPPAGSLVLTAPSVQQPIMHCLRCSQKSPLCRGVAGAPLPSPYGWGGFVGGIISGETFVSKEGGENFPWRSSGVSAVVQLELGDSQGWRNFPPPEIFRSEIILVQIPRPVFVCVQLAPGDVLIHGGREGGGGG